MGKAHLTNGLNKIIKKSDKYSYGRIDHCVSYRPAKFQIIWSINKGEMAFLLTHSNLLPATERVNTPDTEEVETDYAKLRI